MKNSSILIVDDNKSVLSALELLLCGRCRKIKTLSSPNQLLNELQSETYDLVLLDMNFSAGINTGNEGIYWLKRVLDKYPAMGVVMITAYGDIELAVKAVRQGAYDFITKPWDNEKILAVIESACRLSSTRKGVSSRQSSKKVGCQEEDSSHAFQGESATWKKVMSMVQKVAATSANVLITGENGTGKEVVACEIHRLSQRAHAPMVTVDMGAIAEGLFESELFGHRKGAYTDARSDRTGKIEEAHNGTLFLDEIGNLPIPMQAKLLTVLQNRMVTRLGENNPIAVDIRLICATNCDLEERIENGYFREDLLYRINTIQIELPPLRERKADIPGLANYFLGKYAQKYHKDHMQISENAMSLLTEYNWPGNVRELQHAIEKALILNDSHILQPSDFMFRQFEISSGTDVMGSTLEQMEQKLISDALQRHDGNLSSVATQLGITRQTLYNKIKKYGLQTL